jgi:hypothetical protein
MCARWELAGNGSAVRHVCVQLQPHVCAGQPTPIVSLGIQPHAPWCDPSACCAPTGNVDVVRVVAILVISDVESEFGGGAVGRGEPHHRRGGVKGEYRGAKDVGKEEDLQRGGSGVDV